MDDAEKMQRAKVLDLAKRQQDAERERMRREADDRLRELGDTSMHPVRDRIYRLIGQRTV